MSVRVEMKWEGLDDLYTYLNRTLPRKFKAAMIEALDATADDAKEQAKKKCPVVTGSLRKSIRKDRQARIKGRIIYTGIRAGGYIVNPETGRLVDYARFVEYGTSSQRPNPFIRTSVRWAMKNKLPAYFAREISSRVETR